MFDSGKYLAKFIMLKGEAGIGTGEPDIFRITADHLVLDGLVQ